MKLVLGDPQENGFPAQRDIIIIGEAPGAEEDKLGKPFVGKSGQLLDKALVEASTRREDCYITNVCKWWPRDKRGATIKPTAQQIKESLHFLDYELLHVKPKYALLLGDTASSAILKKPLRDTVHEWHKQTYVAWHPAYVLRNGGWESKIGKEWRADLLIFFGKANGIPF